MKSLIPKTIERFPWAGHMGLKSVPAVIEAIESKRSSLIFTNTRSQSEKWYSAILHAKPEWAGKIGLHHGSLDRGKRAWVERELDAGNLHCVVCTSSLDLGVDFFPVEQVMQVGSPKGIARLMQRAGRSGHYPGGKSQLVFVPTHALELIELAAAKDALKQNRIESRVPLTGSLDVLVQHVVTLAAGTPVDRDALFHEVRQTNAFQDLTEVEWQWVLDFVQRGGESLRAYPDFRRVVETEEGLTISDDKIAKRHRMSIGTISSDREVLVKFLKGGRLGTIEERFVSKLKPGDNFLFAGRTLKLVMIRDMTAWVKRAKGKVAALPRWAGGRLPLSSELSEAVRDKLGDAKRGAFNGAEMKAVKPLLELQSQWSEIPDENSLLIEQVKTRDGFHLFVYPFEGRLVHEGLAAILAWRMSRLQPITFATTINDYGIELLSPTEPPLEQAIVNQQRRLIDLAEVSLGGQVVYAFNIIGWGLVADVNVRAEKFRWMGPVRYTVATIVELFRSKRRVGRLTFGDCVIDGGFCFVLACNTMHTGKQMKMAPRATLDDGLIDLVVVRHGPGLFKMLSLFSWHESATTELHFLFYLSMDSKLANYPSILPSRSVSNKGHQFLPVGF
jgi:ATP-dependent Lhr-like helicase